MSDDQDGCEWVSFFLYRPTRVVPDQRLLNGCVCASCKMNLHADRHSVRVGQILCRGNFSCITVEKLDEVERLSLLFLQHLPVTVSFKCIHFLYHFMSQKCINSCCSY